MAPVRNTRAIKTKTENGKKVQTKTKPEKVKKVAIFWRNMTKNSRANRITRDFQIRFPRPRNLGSTRKTNFRQYRIAF
jgi:hypothetical protein